MKCAQQRALILGLYASLVVGGIAFGGSLGAAVESRFAFASDADRNALLFAVLAVYVLTLALPFVPGAEIGWVLIALGDRHLLVLVYAATVLGLCLSYAVGRAVPLPMLARAFTAVGLRRSCVLVESLVVRDEQARIERFVSQAPAGWLPRLVRHRHLCLALALNLPGNTLMGGGGGIALAAGISRLFSTPAYVLTVLLAVSPVPLAVLAFR